MKIVKNVCYGGFGLSALAKRRLAELEGKECYFFKTDLKGKKYTPITVEQAENELFYSTYSVSNPQDYKLHEKDKDGTYKSANERARKISVNDGEDRTDPNLIKVIEELGDKANNRFSKLQIVEIPDGIEREISEYDGRETIQEKHNSR